MISLLPFATNQLPLFHQVAILIINATGLAVILTVLIHNDFKEKLTRTFLYFGLFMFMWVDFAYAARVVGIHNYAWAELFLRTAWVATPPFFACMYYISVLILRREERFRILTFFVVSSSLVLSALTLFSDYIITGISFRGTILDIAYGESFYAFLAVIVLYIIATVVPLFRSNLPPERKSTVHVFMTGIFVFYILNAIFNITLPAFLGISHLYFFGDYSLIFVVTLTGYAILRYSLLDTRVALAELLIFALWIFVGLKLIFTSDLKEQITTSILLAGTVLLGTFLIREVAAEMRQRQEIERLAQNLRKTNEQQENLIHFITHQVKGFFTKSRNIFSVLLEGDYGRVPEPMRRVIEEGFRSDTQGVATVQDILRAANMKSGILTYAFVPVDFKEIVADIAADLKRAAEGKRLSFGFSCDNGSFMIKGDKEQLGHAVRNLIDNSIKYTPEGTVAVRLLCGEKSITLSITDTGIGLSPDDKERLFTEGGRGKESQKINVESTGYGLFIVKNIIEAHGGRVWAESAGRGKGSTFFVEIPVLK